jgi:anti-sigma factor RsiW
MPDCKTLDLFAAPYVDGELEAADRAAVDAHLSACPPCRSRLDAERSVRALIHARHAALCADAAPETLRARCAAACQTATAAPRPAVPIVRPASAFHVWRTRLAPLALAASVAIIAGGTLVYEATDQSSRVMAAELTADHIKCFGLNRVLGTHDTAAAVENAIASSFGLRLALPEQPEREGLELVGERPCLYGEGKIAHIMYRYNGRPVSVFMLPKTTRRDEIVEVMGHEAAIWSAGGRTFVLITREPRPEVERMATFVQASLH